VNRAFSGHQFLLCCKARRASCQIEDGFVDRARICCTSGNRKGGRVRRVCRSAQRFSDLNIEGPWTRRRRAGLENARDHLQRAGIRVQERKARSIRGALWQLPKKLPPPELVEGWWGQLPSKVRWRAPSFMKLADQSSDVGLKAGSCDRRNQACLKCVINAGIATNVEVPTR
jgi:hypothetical protein